MHIVLKRLVESGCRSRIEIEDRLDFWAERYNFRREADERNAFVFSRGSRWRAWFTFDIRRIPTTVKIKTVDEDTGACVCTMTCSSWGQTETSGDRDRLSEHMDLLEACLKGAITEFPLLDPPDAAPKRRHGGDSEHITE